jgi:hypothetical protein
MPEISRFFGIIIRMFVEAGGPHHTPHFHAYYQDHVGIYGIERIERLAGSLPRRQERLVWLGRSFIKKICYLTGRCCSRDIHPLRLNL